jgi:YbbR domain-containing protein
MPSPLKRIFVQNFWIKIGSLLLAIGLWVVVSRDPVGEVELQVPIEFRNVPQNLEIDSASFTEAQVRVRGPGRLIHRLRATDVRAEIDLASVKPGSRTFDLTSRNVRVPSDLEVVQIIPSQFQLSFDDRMTSSVEVRPRVTGIPEGWRARTIADPSTITITGPKRRVVSVPSATTDPVDATGVMDQATFVTQAYVSDPLIQVVHPTPVRVTVIMERSGEEKKPQ